MGSESKSNINAVGGSGEGRTSGLQEMPSTTKKVIQNLKEIVNVPEQEIYAVLKECDMEPNVAIERLLSQDTFHVVKSKRERRKELQMKETQDFRSHVNSAGHNRGGRARQRGSSHMSYNESHNLLNKGENGSVCPSISSTTPVIERHTDSDSSNVNGTQQLAVKNDSSSTSVPSSLSHVSAWSESSKGDLSMAEIVKMGKPPKDSHLFTETFHPFEGSACSYQAKSAQVSFSQPEQDQALVFKNNPDPSLLVDEERGIEQKMASNLPLSDVHGASGEMANLHSNFPGCRSSSFTNHDVDAVQLSSEDLSGRDIRSDNKPASSAFPMKYSAEGASVYQIELKDCSTSDSYIHVQQCGEAAANVQRLSITQTEGKVEVILPNHLQALVDDCPNLSFGTYNAGRNPATPMPILSNAMKNDWKESTAISSGFLDSSYSVNNGSLHDNYRASMGNDNYGYLASSLQEQMKQVFPNATPGWGCINSLSDHDPNLSVADMPTSFYNRADLRSRDFAAFSAEKALCSDSIAREFLASSLKSPRAIQSSYNILQSKPSMYSNTASSLSRSSFSMPEVTKPSIFSLSQQSPLRLQRLGMQPVDRLANCYPSPPQSNVYKMPPNLQPLSDGSGYNLPQPDMKYSFQQNRNEVSMSRMSLFDRDTSTYGNLKSLAHATGSFVHDSPKTSVNSSAYHTLPSQSIGANNLHNLKQNEGFSMYGLGHESAMRSSMSSLPHGTYHQRVEHNQRHVEYQLAQLASSYGVSRYSDLNPSHTGIPTELSRQGGSRDYSKQSLHTWQR